MVLRVIVGVSWSAVAGLAGGWLALSPWALSEQPSSGDWTNVTQTQFWTGVGLIALAVIGLVMVAAQLAAALRAAPRGAPNGGGRSAGGAQNGGGPEMDAALVALANALVADLNHQPAAQPAPPAPQSPLQAERWRADR